jgi:nucleoside-diphosphate-sugar epimerase
MRRVLVTGGTGFIGQHTITPLIERGYEVHVVTSHFLPFSTKEVIYHRVDLLDCGKHQYFMEHVRPTHLLHAAWYTQHGKFWEAVENVYWLKATLSLADAFYAAGGERILALGTCAEYDWTDGFCIENRTAEAPLSLYGKVKKTTYECLSALSKAQSKSFIWARIFFPYGSGESQKRLIPHVITNLLKGDEVHCTHGNQIRDFLYVPDIGEAVVATLDADLTGLVNIGSGIPLTIREIVSQIALMLGKENLVCFGAMSAPVYSPEKILADITRLKAQVNWSAKFSLDEGLSKTIDWWRGFMNLTSE